MSRNWYVTSIQGMIQKCGEAYICPAVREAMYVFEFMCIEARLNEVTRTEFSQFIWVDVDEGGFVSDDPMPLGDDMIVIDNFDCRVVFASEITG